MICEKSLPLKTYLQIIKDHQRRRVCSGMNWVTWLKKKMSLTSFLMTMAQTFQTLLDYRYCPERLYFNVIKSSVYFHPSHFKSKRHLVKSSFHCRNPGLVNF